MRGGCCPLMEGHMFSKSVLSNTAEPSFFYLLIAATSFQRAGRAGHRHAGDALRDIGREYLAKAASMSGIRCMPQIEEGVVGGPYIRARRRTVGGDASVAASAISG
jgi:hypothetical protein